MTRGSADANDNDPLWVAEGGGRRSATPYRGRGQDTDLSTGHRRCRGSTCGYGAGIPGGIRHTIYGVGFLLPSLRADQAVHPSWGGGLAGEQGWGGGAGERVSGRTEEGWGWASDSSDRARPHPLTPGLLRYAIIYTTPTGCRGDKGGLCFPGVVGATPLRPPGYEKRIPPGCLSPTSPACRSRRGGIRGALIRLLT